MTRITGEIVIGAPADVVCTICDEKHDVPNGPLQHGFWRSANMGA